MSSDKRQRSDVPDARALFSRGFVYSAATAAQALASLLIVPWVTRRMAPEAYGVIAVSLIAGQIVAVVSSMGLPAAVTRGYFQNQDGQRHSRTIILLAAWVALAVAAVAHMLGPVWAGLFGALRYGASLQLAVLWGCLAGFTTSAQAHLHARGRALVFLATVLVQSAGGHLAGAVLATETGNPALYMVGLAAMNGVAAILALAWTMPGGLGPLTYAVVTRTAAISLPLVPHALSMYVLAMGDRVVVERLLGLDMVARYHASYIAGGVTVAVVLALNNAWAPLILGTPIAERWQVLADTTAILERLTAVGAGALAMAAPILAVVLVPSSYGPATLHPVIAIIAASALPMVAYLAAGHALLSQAKTRALGVITPVVAILNLVLNLIVVPLFGMIGAALATLVCYFLLAVAVGFVASRFVTIPWRWADRVKSVILLGLLVGLTHLLPTAGPMAWSRVIVVTSLGAFAFVLVRDAIHESNRGPADSKATSS